MRIAASAAIFSAMAGAHHGLASTYSDVTTGGLWGTSANWTGGVPNAAGAVADFSQLTLGANNTVHLDSSYTVGTLDFGDVGNTYSWTLDNNGNFANVLTLASGTSAAPVINVVNQQATISGSISGTQGFTKTGSGILELTGASTYTGVTTIANGTLVLGSTAATSSAPSSGLVLDLDPINSTVATSGGVVTSVSDLSGQGNAATSTNAAGSVTLSTINGHKALSLNGASGLLDPTFSASGDPQTVFAVIDPTSTTGPSAIVGANVGNGGAGGLEVRLEGGYLHTLNEGEAGYAESTSTVPANTLSIVAYTYNSSSGTYYLNGNAIGTTAAPSLPSGGILSLGYQHSYYTSQDYFSGTIGTVLVYNSSMGSSQIAAVESFLASEYANSSSTLGTTEINLNSANGSLAIASASQSISSLAGVAGSNVYLGGGILTVGTDGTSTLFAGNISDTGTGAVGTGGQLVKVGAGTLNLSGGISNSGGLQVNAGTLLISGTYSSSGPTSVTGGILSITGTDVDTGSHTITGGVLSISGTNATSGPFTISNGATLSLSGASIATGAISIPQGGSGTLTLVANANNITGSGASETSSAIGSPSGVVYANNLGTTTVQLRSDTSVTFANSGPTGGTGGYPNYTTIDYDVNNVGGGSTATGQTLTLGSTTAGASGFGTYDTYINVTGGNGYTMAIPAITNANNVFLNLNASTANLSIPGGITNVGTLTVNGAANTSLGTITGAGPLIKSGAGKLTLTSSNTYTGATNISAGTLSLASGASFTATSGISIASGATFDISNNPSFALPSSSTVLSGTGTINGSYNHSIGSLLPGMSATNVGTLTVNGNLTLSGGAVDLSISGSNNSTGGLNDLINVTGGLNVTGLTNIVLLPVTPTLPSGTTWTVITYNNSSGFTGSVSNFNLSTTAFTVLQVPGAIELKYLSGVVGADIWTGSVNSNWDTSTTNFVSAGTSSPIAFTNGDNVTFNDTSSVTSVNLATSLSPTAVTVNSNVNNYTFSGSGSITGSGSLTKLGTSTLTINSSNTYSGATNIAGGVVINAVSAGSGLGTGPLIIGPGATLVIGNGTSSGTPGSGSFALANSSITDNGTLAYNGTTFNVIPVAIIGSGGVNVSAGTLGIGSQNNYTGNVTVIGSTADIEAYEASSLGSGNIVTIDGGGSVDLSYNTLTYTSTFNISGSAIHTYGGNNVTTITGPINLFDGDATLGLYGGLVLTNTITATNNQNLTATGGTLTLEGNVSLGTGSLQSGGNLVFAPPASTTITIAVGSVNDFIEPATVNQNGAGTTILNGSNTYSGGTTVTTGKLVFNAPYALPNFTALTIAAKGTAVVSNYSIGSIKNTLFTSSLSIATGGKLDLGNNDLVVQNGSLTTITAEVAAGYNNGAWNGSTGIVSSAAAADTTHLHALGVIQNSVDQTTSGAILYNSFDGATESADTDVLVKYTYYGDANLDGKVDGSDYSLIDATYLAEQTTATSISGWYNGDFNYDGVVNGSDYTLIDNAFNLQGTQIATEIAAPTAEIIGVSGASSSVPEPATLGLFGIMAAGLLGRRRRRD